MTDFPQPNTFVIIVRRAKPGNPGEVGEFESVVGYFDGFGNWKRLVWCPQDFSWWPEETTDVVSWRPIDVGRIAAFDD